MNSNNTNELLSKINEKYAKLSKGQKLSCRIYCRKL